MLNKKPGNDDQEMNEPLCFVQRKLQQSLLAVR